jgi:hypothetical protein
MSEREFDDGLAPQLREEIEDRLRELAQLEGPEDVLAYIARLAERMREELEER